MAAPGRAHGGTSESNNVGSEGHNRLFACCVSDNEDTLLMAAGAGGTFLASLARMNKKTIDALLTAMLQTSDGVSDLLFICGRPPLVEIHGQLTEFPIDTPTRALDA